MSKLSLWKTILLLGVLCAAEAIGSPAQTFTSLFSFNGSNGSAPLYMALVQGTDGNFYGTTSAGGIYGYGAVFKITPGGKVTVLHSFDGTDGEYPDGGLIQGTDGNFYGTTVNGGTSGYGTIFKMTLAGTLTTLHGFAGYPSDGGWPYDVLVQGTDGNFYGTTNIGGAKNNGTVFKITAGGTLTTLYSFSFTGGGGDGPTGGLVQGTDGNFYGTTMSGGTIGVGTVFKMTPAGTLTTLHSFDGTDGAYPFAGLIQATDGNFYGTTFQGGTHSGVTIGGTVFKITSAGTLTTLHSFCSQTGCTDGSYPYARLVQGTDANFYGTTAEGGTDGTVFKITPGGILTTLHRFDFTDGAGPLGGLLQATNGDFYGTTPTGGAQGDGTVFSLSVGLGPFVETRPTSGKVGAAVKILGNNLTGATSVTFNGRLAVFTVVSSTEIKTSVPIGATTGKVKVTTPKGMLTSNVKFRVTPTISSFSPTSGPVGTSVVITGESFTGATSVTFGGVKATSFTVDSYTQITATVPTGAKTGKIGVATPGGTATSAGTFTVT
jgi:uncharacterized repeat protein (TIGR03803 family)